MPQPVNSDASQIHLQKVIGIGFSGHRKLEDEAKCRALICEFLSDRKAKVPGIVYGISSAAAGADLLFCECCISLDIPLRILLPSSRQDFKGDFEPADWARAEALFAQAISVEETSDGALKSEKYYECGIRTIQESQVLLALWDGEPARGLGGTEQMVTFARKIGRPTFWINTDTGATEIFNRDAMESLLVDPELDFLNGLPDMGSRPATGSQGDRAKAWLQKLDENATRFAPHVRRLAVVPILCTSAAAFLTGAGLHLPHPQQWLTVGTILGVVAIVIPLLLRLPQQRLRWERTRAAAEVCRSILAVWHAQLTQSLIEPEMLPELAGMITTLDLMKALDMRDHPGSLAEFKKDYRVNRIADQEKFFSRQAMKAERLAQKTRLISAACIALACSVGVFDFVAHAAFKNTTWMPGHDALSVAISALFQISTIAIAFAMIKDSNRRKSRYQELSDWLRTWDAELESLMTWQSVLRVVGRIERALLVELLEWRSLMRHSQIGRK